MVELKKRAADAEGKTRRDYQISVHCGYYEKTVAKK